MSLSAQFHLQISAWLVLALVFGSSVEAQPASSVDSFDLILMGDSLRPSAHTVELRSNPTAGENWTELESPYCTETGRLLVFPTQPVQRYLGQDIRENYLALKVVSETRGGSLRSAYTVPSAGTFEANNCEEIAHLIESQPMRIRRHSLAVYERPRPAHLRPDKPFIDHIEAPVRHRKPGVMEVEWLEILFP
jgi:hypothetical protein